MERGRDLIKLRPEIPAAKITEGISDVEEFQNLTLRPIIKFQNDFLIRVYSNFARSYQKDWGSISNEKKELFIETSMNKNQNLKNKLIGSVIGFFTKEELDIYFQYNSELNRRIVQIIKQRVLSNLSNI
jgi:hypothetical protein